MYLEEYVSLTLEDSVHQTVLKRIGIAKHTLLEIRAVIEDSRARSIESITSAFKMWDASVLQMLLFGCETWSPVPKKIINKLNDLTTKFLKVTLGVGKYGCPLGCPKMHFILKFNLHITFSHY